MAIIISNVQNLFAAIYMIMLDNKDFKLTALSNDYSKSLVFNKINSKIVHTISGKEQDKNIITEKVLRSEFSKYMTIN